MNGYCSRKIISNEAKKHVLMTGLEFDPTGDRSTLIWSSDVA